jgi:hypothetical protein
MWGARESFLPAVGMVVAVVMQVVFVLWLLKNAIKHKKLVVCKLFFIIYYIFKNILQFM